MSKSTLALIAILLIGAVAVVWYRSQVFGGNSDSTVRPNLVVVSGGTGPYWQLLTSGSKAAADDLDATVELLMPPQDEDFEGQMKLLSQIKADEVDGVAISPLDAEKQTLWINRMADDTYVVSVDSDAPLSNRLSYVGASNFGAGKLCGEMVQEVIPDGGKLVVLLANLTKDNMQERKLGLEDELADPDRDDDAAAARYEVVEFLLDDGDAKRSAEQLKQVISEHDDLACIVGMNGYHGPIILKTLKGLDKVEKIQVVAFDTEVDTLDGVESGAIYATIAQDPYQYGYEAVRLLCDYCRRQKRSLPLRGSKSTVNIGTQAVKKDNLEEFRKDYVKRLKAATPATTNTTDKAKPEPTAG